MEMLNAFNDSVRELQNGIQQHCCLVASMLEANASDHELEQFRKFCPYRSREQRLVSVITDAIEELEATRKAFKSKKLEALRKKLTHALIDNA